MTTELISRNITSVQLFSENGLDPVLDRIKSEIDNFKPDTSTGKGRKEIASLAYKIAQSKTFIEKAGKELVSGIKSKAKLIDAERKRSRDTLDEWKEEVRKPLTEWEAAEAKKKELERLQIKKDMDHEEALGMDDLFNREAKVKRKEAELVKQEEERLAKEKAEQEEKERLENEARIKKEAEEKAKKDAEDKIKFEREEKERIEREALEAKEQSELDRIAAEKKAKADQEAAVKKAQDDADAKIKAEKEAEGRRIAEVNRIAEKKAANTRHQASVNNKIKTCLMTIKGIDETIARDIIIAIAKGEIDFLKILY